MIALCAEIRLRDSGPIQAGCIAPIPPRRGDLGNIPGKLYRAARGMARTPKARAIGTVGARSPRRSHSWPPLSVHSDVRFFSRVTSVPCDDRY